MKASPKVLDLDRYRSRRIWWAAYNAWAERATAEARTLYPTGHLEVSEDGAVYLGNLAWLPAGSVEPWEDTQHNGGLQP